MKAHGSCVAAVETVGRNFESQECRPGTLLLSAGNCKGGNFRYLQQSVRDLGDIETQSSCPCLWFTLKETAEV